MSHASGAVLFKDGTIKYYEYDGTSDVVISMLHDDLDGVEDNWRTGNTFKCNCRGEEDVEIYTSYGYGSCFMGKACKKCMSIRTTCGMDEYPKNIWHGTKNNMKPDWLKREEEK